MEQNHVLLPQGARTLLPKKQELPRDGEQESCSSKSRNHAHQRIGIILPRMGSMSHAPPKIKSWSPEQKSWFPGVKDNKKSWILIYGGP